MPDHNNGSTPSNPSELEDSLGSALASSFTIPPRERPTAEPLSAMAAVSTAAAVSGDAEAPVTEEKDEEFQIPAGEEEVPGMKEWKDTYEGYLKAWHAESAEARAKALETREKYEKENEEKEKAAAQAVKDAKKAKAAEEKKERDRKKLLEEVEGKTEEKERKDKEGEPLESRDQKVKEAWQLVMEGEKAEPSKAAETKDSDEASAPAEPSPQAPAPTDSQTLSRESASQSWENISKPSSSTSQETTAEDLVEIPRPGRATAPQTPPSAPPSLTLSLFTMPSHLSISRVFAVLGINLVLPFINGVMLGFGEIFAREVVRVGQTWYRTTGSIYDQLFGGPREPRSGGVSGARGVSGVGLSGSRGF